MRKATLFLVLLLFLTACPDSRKYGTGHFQENVVNFSDLNSKYDDYNMDSPFIEQHSLFHFSSNRKSNGGNFDIVGTKMYIEWSKTEGTLTIREDLYEDWFDYLIPLFDSVNTSCNELGPYTLGYLDDDSPTPAWNEFLLYANDCDGDFDIKFVYCEKKDSFGSEVVKMHPAQEVSFINTGSNELYPSFYGPGFLSFAQGGTDPGKIEKMLFCSDRTGNFDIFVVNLPAGLDMREILNGEFIIEPGTLSVNSFEWNSASDDKCPFANGRLLVFASNRPGGYGGFDLYYSLFIDGTWSEPVNFGQEINTEYDEYRPVTIHHGAFDNNLMIFSSNRPGGYGGFDLYHVGFPQLIR